MLWLEVTQRATGEKRLINADHISDVWSEMCPVSLRRLTYINIAGRVGSMSITESYEAVDRLLRSYDEILVQRVASYEKQAGPYTEVEN